ncbi:restriction endonuclease subunit S [Bosea sp. (in: a-proteobacteria)]|uniref:restriction endonuclease subunit S n=1 Tax=Bosea sp. (in: a-proteobacteria) TaxID=1871050 RepID=UPI003B3A0CED
MGINLARLPKSPPPGPGPVPIIHVKDVVEGMLLDADRLDRISLPDTPQNARQRLLPGDVLVSARGTLMKCAVVPPSHWGAVASANFIVIRLGQSAALPPELLWTFLRQPTTQAYVLSRNTSTAQAALNIRDLEDLSIPIPPQNIQSDLVQLIVVAEEQYRTAMECARLRQEEAMAIVARHMASDYAS